MQTIFGTRSVSLREGAVAIGTGVVLLIIVEAEQRLRFLLGRTFKAFDAPEEARI